MSVTPVVSPLDLSTDIDDYLLPLWFSLFINRPGFFNRSTLMFPLATAIWAGSPISEP